MRITIKLILMLALVSTPAVAENLFVPSQFGTIQQAVNAASPGDRILVAAGMHVGASINKPVTILGVGNLTVIFDGPTFVSPPFFFQQGFELFVGAAADGTKIGDLKIDLSTGAVGDIGSLELVQIGIFSSGASGGTVRHVTCIGLSACIDIRNGIEWKITDNTVEGLNATTARRGRGIQLIRTSDFLVAFNTITHSSPSLSNAGKTYWGIALRTGPIENNKIIQNEIVIDAPGSVNVRDILLFDPSANVGGPVTVFDNKIIANDADSIDLIPASLFDHNVVQ